MLILLQFHVIIKMFKTVTFIVIIYFNVRHGLTVTVIVVLCTVI